VEGLWSDFTLDDYSNLEDEPATSHRSLTFTSSEVPRPRSTIPKPFNLSEPTGRKSRTLLEYEYERASDALLAV
jgi:hypothetical protein